MKKIYQSFLLVITATLFLAFQAQAATMYNSITDFTAAFPDTTFENFVDSTFEPGLSVNSTYAGATIATSGTSGLGYAYSDRLNDTDTTTWTHANGFTAWGGFFDLFNPGGPGSGIIVTVVDTNEVIGTIASSYAGQFWGFTTGYTFSQVRLSTEGGQETYLNIDLAYQAAPVPEPATMVLLGIGLLGIAGVSRKKTRA